MLNTLYEGTAEKSLYSRIKGGLKGLFDTSPTPRIMLFFVAIVIKLAASAISATGFVFSSGALMLTGVFIWLLWFALLFIIAMPQADVWLQSRMHWLKPTANTIAISLLVLGAVLLIIISCFGLGVLQVDRLGEKPAELIESFDNVFAYNDATALCHQATENLLEGRNPYADANVVSAMQQFDGQYDKVTPLRTGVFADVFPYPSADELEHLWLEASATPETVPPELETKLGYPAGCFLLTAPFVLAGIQDIRIIYLILIIPALAYIIWKAPPGMRLLFIAAVLASLEIWNSVAAGETGSLYFPFLLLAWVLTRKNMWLSALFMGIAVATKQVAWFFMPFYLILIWRTVDLKKALSALAVIGTIFLAVNMPFIISDPGLWVSSLMSPMIDDMFPLGVGVINLVSGGFIGIDSSLSFSIMEIVVGIAAVVWYFRNCRRYPHTGPLLAVLPLFFAWRSLWPYFYYIDIIILAAVIIDEYGRKTAADVC